jgi:hypothetical protein
MNSAFFYFHRNEEGVEPCCYVMNAADFWLADGAGDRESTSDGQV